MKRYMIFLLVPFLLACAVSANTSAQTVNNAEVIYTLPTDTPTVAPTLTEFHAHVLTVRITAAQLHIRPQASTTGTIDGTFLVGGDLIGVEPLITNDCADCRNWYKLVGRPGWICADFTEVVK